jgi:hypothetical protein
MEQEKLNSEQYLSPGLGLEMESSEEIFEVWVAVLMGIVQNLHTSHILPVMSLWRLLYLYKQWH